MSTVDLDNPQPKTKPINWRLVISILFFVGIIIGIVLLFVYDPACVLPACKNKTNGDTITKNSSTNFVSDKNLDGVTTNEQEVVEM